MRQSVKLPKLGDTADDAVIIEIYKMVGDIVAVGDGLMLVETNKAEIEVPSPVAGTVVEVLIKVNIEVTTGTTLMIVES